MSDPAGNQATQYEDPLTGHEFDGIREYDNPCPSWWSWLFFGTFVFSVVYFLFFQFSLVAWTIEEDYQEDVVADLKRQFAEIGDLTPDEPTVARFLNDAKWLTVGEVVFSTNCVSCHGPQGEGLVGPNLTDDAYKNVKRLGDIVRVVSDGAANGAMPAWKNRLHVNELVLVSAYVASLRGKNVPGRAPEGQPIPPWPRAAADQADAGQPAGGAQP